MGLNPYCSGQWSRTMTAAQIEAALNSLNPYCSGQWSRTCIRKHNVLLCLVLILIVVDNGLVQAIVEGKKYAVSVLILIVVDNGLVPFKGFAQAVDTASLNPYCSGQWSRTLLSWTICANMRVLILIVVDNGLVLDLIRHY